MNVVAALLFNNAQRLLKLDLDPRFILEFYLNFIIVIV